MADWIVSKSLTEDLRRDRMHAEDLSHALSELKRRCDREGIPFAVIGALAMRRHGSARHTEDIDIVTTPEGLERIHGRLVGHGVVPRATGDRKKLRDTVHRVDIDVLTAGEYAGADGSPVRYPEPSSDAFVASGDGIRYATLPALVSFKIASGVWGKRSRDLADVEALIKATGIDETFAESLPEVLPDRFMDLVRSSREERDIE
jgi:hypothetical protein